MTNNQRFAAEMVVLLTIGIALLSGASPARQDAKSIPDTLTTHSLLIVDQQGIPRAKLTADENAPGLLLLGRDGKTVRGRFVIFPDPDHKAQYEASGPTLDLSDKGGGAVATLSTRSLGKNETTFLHLHRGDYVPLHMVPDKIEYADTDIIAGDDGNAGIYMISVPAKKKSAWAEVMAMGNGSSEVVATRFNPATIFDDKGSTKKSKR